MTSPAPSLLQQIPRVTPPLDPDFRPAVLGNRAFEAAAQDAGGVPLKIAIAGAGSLVHMHETAVLPDHHPQAAANLAYVERLVKMLLWQVGGHRVVVGGPAAVGDHIRRTYAEDGARAFDARLMGDDIFGAPFTVDVVDVGAVPDAATPAAAPRGRHWRGCRIGFDAGASDHKVAAVVDGDVVFSAEVPWLPAVEPDPQVHIDAITAALREAARHLERVDAVGISAAGVYLDNRVKVASLFRAVPRDVFRARVANLFPDVVHGQWPGVPLEVVNDGEVAALAGSMALHQNAVLGIALGSSEAAGYVTAEGHITRHLNELAFAPLDHHPAAPVDEWSGDRGCGAQYLSQQAVIRLAGPAGLDLDATRTPAERLRDVQARMADGDPRAEPIFATVGTYLGYALAHYADFYDARHVTLMGRVVSGAGGPVVLGACQQVLEQEFPALHAAIEVTLPDERSRRVGQAVAAASLPSLPS